MKKIIILFVLSIIINACSSNEDNIEKDTYTYSFYKNSKLTINEVEDSYMKEGKIDSGDKLVFKYLFSAYDNKEVADDEFNSEVIMFEIDPNISSFTYSDSQLLDIKSVFTKYCFCVFSNEQTDKDVAPTGTISGTKISDKYWDIKINVTFYGNEVKTVNKKFTLMN
ncbi:hypothetical protein [Tenacibaculum crassostreae]|uniref:hypothetical protein n=1 Tax=Tenacibaculum crassostreae TaxID=502683 RepID=UPI003893929B